jgi:hypothetical protein
LTLPLAIAAVGVVLISISAAAQGKTGDAPRTTTTSTTGATAQQRARSAATTRSLPPPPGREYSFDLWDWTAPCRDLHTFKKWAADLKRIGVTRLEFSAPWNVLEPEPGRYELGFVADRVKIARSLGLGVRIRINSYYGGATPKWYRGDFWQDIHGSPPTGTPVPPSICDQRFWSLYGPLCTKIAAACKGEDVYFNAFIGIHAELKWANWWSYDPATLSHWRETIADRPGWLRDLAGDAKLPDKPPVPAPTHGRPDNSPVSKAWIAFRQQVWREAVERFNAAIHKGDPDARISAPLGESFRSQSAQFSNLDYYGLSRGASQVVHSYDFYWHPKDPAWMAAAAVASFRGITGIHDVVFEFDGPDLIEKLGYTEAKQLEIARAAHEQRAGLKAANYSYSDRLPSSWPVLVAFGKIAAESPSPAQLPAREQTILLFMSKWANYCYREPTQWLHDAQFGAWRMLTTDGLAVRFICEDNLDEDLSHYRGLYVAFSPTELMPQRRARQIETLEAKLPSIVEFERAPDAPPPWDQSRILHFHGTGRRWIIEYPLGYQWLRGDRSAEQERLEHLVSKTWGSKP